jgi:hypothetical protein
VKKGSYLPVVLLILHGGVEKGYGKSGRRVGNAAAVKQGAEL